MLLKHSFHPKNYVEFSTDSVSHRRELILFVGVFFRVPRDPGLIWTTMGWHSSTHVFFFLLSVLVRNVGSEGRLGLNPSSATYKPRKCEYLTSPYSHWIGSCLPIPLHLLPSALCLPSSSPLWFLSAPGTTGTHTQCCVYTKRPAWARLFLIVQDSAQRHFLRKSLIDNSIYSHPWPVIFYVIHVFVFLKAQIPIWNFPTSWFFCLLSVFPNWNESSWNLSYLVLCAVSPVSCSVPHI